MQRLQKPKQGYKLVKSPFGKYYEIPDDWDAIDLGQLLSLEYGAGLTESERRPGIYPVFGSNGIVGYHNQPLVDGPGIIIGRKGSIGEVVWTGTSVY